MNKFLNSLWLLLLLTYFTSWIAFIYIGITGKKSKWILYGLLYLSSPVYLQVIGETGLYTNPLLNSLVILFMALWIVSIIHGIAVSRSYLKRLEVIKEEEDVEDLSRIKRELRNLSR